MGDAGTRYFSMEALFGYNKPADCPGCQADFTVEMAVR